MLTPSLCIGQTEENVPEGATSGLRLETRPMDKPQHPSRARWLINGDRSGLNQPKNVKAQT